MKAQTPVRPNRLPIGPLNLFGIFLCLLFAPCESVRAITLTGSNGRAVEFAVIETATPKGITVRMAKDGPVIGITWDKIDLAALERDHPSIHAAYKRTQELGDTVELAMGGEAAPSSAPANPGGAPAADAPKYHGWQDTMVGKVEFMLQLPAGKAKGILLLSQDDYGDSFRWVRSHERGSGYWGVFQTKYDLALLTYDTGETNRDPTVIDDFVFPEKGSGKAVFTALSNFASKMKQPGLSDLPIAVYGNARVGAAFAYNFIHAYPERILAAALYDGAHYDAPPTEASAKVPMLFIWGQYSNFSELWRSENNSVAVLAKAAPLKPLWTNAREFRGRGELNEVVEHFAKQYLISMIEPRMPKAGTTSAPEEGKAAPAAGTPAPAEGEAPAAPEKSGPPVLPEIDRSAGSIGNILTGEVLKITDPEVVPGEDETYLPNETVIRYWKPFVLGELEAPARTPPQ